MMMIKREDKLNQDTERNERKRETRKNDEEEDKKEKGERIREMKLRNGREEARTWEIQDR